METIRAAVIDRRSSAKDDDEFILHLNTLIRDHGDMVCPLIFSTLANIDLSEKAAKKYWLDVQNHRQQLSHQLGRTLSLTTAISDYLHTYTTFLPKPCLVDAVAYERAVSGTIHDNLTGLYNRPYFDETYEQQIALAKRYGTDLTILFLDIDNFKEVNDNFGHLAGDLALQQVSEVIGAAKRESDIAARYGGEEFVLLMPNTNTIDAAILAERIRARVEKMTISFRNVSFQLTISGGLASFPLNSTNPKDLLFMADSAVYLAKGSGKNAITQFRDEQRRYLRIKFQREVLVRNLGFDHNEVFSGLSHDICLGGIMLENESAIPLGSLQEMSIAMNGRHENPLLLIGRVVRLEKRADRRYNIGLSFSFKEMHKEASEQIAAFLKNYTSQPRQATSPRAISH